jgi:hydrophobic/amphiphilic exporter-1 (mainly G- bacteria), HAE1 family
MNLPRWSLRYPITASMVIVCAIVVGAVSTTKLPLAFLPEVDFPGLEINIPYPNALPAQVEEEITRPAEEALATLSRVRRMSSWSSNNAANIYVEFAWGEDIEPIRVEAKEKLERIRSQLPADVDLIHVNSFRSSDIPVLECRISADRDLSHSFEMLDRHVADPLRRVPGVAKVELYGVDPPEVQIRFHMDALRRHGLSAREVIARLESSNRSLSAGQIRGATQELPLRIVNDFRSLQEIEEFPINESGLLLSSVATIAYAEPELDYGRHLDDSRAIGLNVIKESGANTVAVAIRARKALTAMAKDPALEGIQVLTFTDQAEQILNSIKGLVEAGVIGALLATGVLFFFLRRLAATMIVALAIPVCLLATAALLYFTGRSLNILSMMGLMLAVGLVVDNAVVVLESIERVRARGLGRLHAALRGSREVMPAVVSSTLTSVIVFLPLVVGARTEISTWIGEVGRTIIYTLACSLFLSLTAIPLAIGRVLPASRSPRIGSVEWLGERYQRVLGWTLKHRGWSIAIGVVVFAGAVVAFGPVDKSAFTASKVESVQITYEFADNVNHLEAERYVTRIESWIHANKDSAHVKSTYSFFTNNFAMTRAYLVTSHTNDDGAQEARDWMRPRLPVLPGCKLEMRGQNDDSGPSRLVVRLFGDPGPRMDGLAEDVARRLSQVPGLTDVEVGGEKGRQEVQVAVHGHQAAHYGLSPSQIGSDVSMFFRGQPLARFRGPDGDVEVNARLDESDRESMGQLEDMPVRTSSGGTVPLAAIADFRTVETPGQIQRQQRRSVVVVSGNLASSQGGTVRKEATRVMNGMTLPPGYSWSYGSGFEEEDQTQMELLINMLLALFLVYFVMAGLFESLVQPFAIMFALPFAFVGIALMCLSTGTPFNLMSQIGILILMGIVVNNGIVLIHHVHQLRERGVPRHEAIMQAARDRLRPILMTTTTNILGLLPLAIGHANVGDIMYFPLARTVIGGLASATVLTLLLVPVLYTVIEDTQGLFGRVWRFGPRGTPRVAAVATPSANS